MSAKSYSTCSKVLWTSSLPRVVRKPKLQTMQKGAANFFESSLLYFVPVVDYREMNSKFEFQ
jgi:hypothetical protein